MKHISKFLWSLAFCLAICLPNYAQQIDDSDINDNMESAAEDSIAIRTMTEIKDSAIIFPESLDPTLDTLLTGWLVKNFVHIDNNCISDVENPSFPDSIYIQRLKALPNVIDMPYNQPVRSVIDLYVCRRRSLVEYMIGLGQFYFPMFEDALSRYNMPQELKYLAVIESALKASATSRVGAAGLWQFMPSTGKLLGLEINSVIDERRDPVKSTDAACRYLSQLHDIYGDWTLAIAAYNCGPGNVNKAIKRSGGKRNFWEIYFYLPRETRTYVPAFIAANYVMNYHCEHNLCAVMTELPPVTDTVMVSRMVHFKQISTMLNLPIEQIRALNPQYSNDLVPGNHKVCALRLPAQKVYEFIEHEDAIVAYDADKLLPKLGDLQNMIEKGTSASKAVGGGKYHVVRRGETLSTIARKYGTTVKKIKKLNGLRSDRLRVKQRLRVR